ncbi:hypothetical protein ZYGR_0H02730 [Zygosaccharomyces rouxii]|uniref:ZYRO0B10296p n=2 Tax=Zygosaccharomyces rouxii TaxID=4956 RepID=C5DRQ2_ZYGRC|nr:uncharacterized protein ZYRO0B10296g [Zygosaccharomyces rouxii]KAH9200002.1 hypothetical protein LQ764DRAFT_196246 [Zygosaccharomyces rouxii]GAV47431.1 hypothetical protein ZYGR_0H02730 [Zygosaccharomyces rouxii]CAR26463.1 ZYRO0B10296p [Zygosaccharomyces rouxii]
MDDAYRVQQLLAQNENLSFDQSRESLKVILRTIDETNDPFQFDFAQFLLNCDGKILCREATPETHFWEIFEETMSESPPETLAICLTRICTLSLRESGVYLEAVVHLCRFLSSSEIILPILCANLSTQRSSIRLNFDILESIDGVLRCLTCLCESDKVNAAIIIPSCFFMFHDCGFWSILISLLPMEELQSEILEVILPLRDKISKFMSALTLKEYATPLETKMFEAVEDALSLDSSMKEKFEEVNQGYNDLRSIKLINAYHLVVFLKNSNLSFKKTLGEELLFVNNPFPLYKAFFNILDQLDQFLDFKTKDILTTLYHAAFLLSKDAFIYALMDKLLKMWVASQGKTRKDMDSLLETVPIMLDQVDKSMKRPSDISPRGSVIIALETLEGIDYGIARQLQLESIKEKHYNKWSNSIGDFDELLSEQVHDYVRHQRLLQLQKGAWVYSESPLDRHIRSPKVYFMVLSANQINLLVREFPAKAEITPHVEENQIFSNTEKDHAAFEKTVVIPLHNIVDFEVNELQTDNKVPDDARLVNVIRKDFYTGVNFLDKYRRVVLKVYFDTKEDTIVWLDGLKLVSPFKIKQSITDDTQKQMDTLVSIRRNAQMLNLDISDGNEITDSNDDEEYYHADTLKDLTSSFYYE